MTWLAKLAIGAMIVAALVPVGLLTGALVLARRTTFRRPDHRPARPDEIPDPIPGATAAAVETLGELGFEPLGWAMVRQAAALSPRAPEWAPNLLLVEPSTGSIAFLEPSETLGESEVSVHIRTHYEDGTCVVTSFAGDTQDLVEVPQLEVISAPGLKPGAVWRAHAAAIAGRPGARHGLTLEQCLELEQGFDLARYAALLEQGWIVPRGGEDDSHRLIWRGVFRYAATALRFFGGAFRSGELRGEFKDAARTGWEEGGEVQVLPELATPELPADAPIEEEVDAYLRAAARKRKPRGAKVALAILVGTGALFALSFSRWIEPEQLLVVVGVVLFHELGHLAAMRAFGYQDTSIFFIPFLGAAATGRKLDPKPMEELVVLLAGPLPGLLLGTALFFAVPDARAQPLLWAAIAWLVGLNWFNLLPFVPLDGGRVVQLLVTARRPWLEVLLRGGAGVALLALAAADRSILLSIVGIVVLASARHGYRAAVLRRHLADTPEEALRDERSRARLALEAIREKGMGSLPSPARFALAAELTHRSGLRAPGLLGRVLGLATYGLCLLAVPAGVFLTALLSSLFAPPGPGPDEFDYEPTPFHGEPSAPHLTVNCADAEARELVAGEAHPALREMESWRWTLLASDPESAAAAALDEARARELLGPLAEGTRVTGRSSWHRLLVATLESTDPSLGAAIHLRTIETAGEARGDRWLIHPGFSTELSLALACETADPRAATALARELSRYLDEPHDLELRPPWEPGPDDPERAAAEARARATSWAFDAALMEETDALHDPARFDDVPEDLEERAAWFQEKMQRDELAFAAAVERAYERVREKPGVDLETLELARSFDLHMGDERRPAIARALGERLGRSTVPALRVVGSAEPHESTVWLPFLSPASTGEVDALLSGVSRHLCDSGCSELRVWLADWDEVRGD